MYQIDETLKFAEEELLNKDVFSDPKIARIAKKSRHYFLEALEKEFGTNNLRSYGYLVDSVYQLYQQHQMIELLKEQNVILQKQNAILQEQNNILKQQLIKKQPEMEK